MGQRVMILIFSLIIISGTLFVIFSQKQSDTMHTIAESFYALEARHLADSFAEEGIAEFNAHIDLIKYEADGTKKMYKEFSDFVEYTDANVVINFIKEGDLYIVESIASLSSTDKTERFTAKTHIVLVDLEEYTLPPFIARYFASLKSDVYHNINCFYVPRILEQNHKEFATEQDALDEHYRACTYCIKKPELAGAGSEISAEPSGYVHTDRFHPISWKEFPVAITEN